MPSTILCTERSGSSRQSEPIFAGALPGASNMRARPEAALPVGLAVVEARVRQCRPQGRRSPSNCADCRDRRSGSRSPSRRRARPSRARPRRAEIFRRLPSRRPGRWRDRSGGSSAPDVDPPQHLRRRVPVGAFAEHRLWHRRRMSISIMVYCLPMVRPATLAAEAARIAAAMSEKASLASDTVTRMTSAVDDEKRAVRKIERRQQAGQDGEHEGAGDRADIVPAAAEDRGAADGDRGDRGEEVGVSHAEIGLAGIAGQENTCERGGEAGNRVGGYAGAQRRNAGEFRHAGARADRVEMASEAVFESRNAAATRQRGPDEQHHRHGDDPADREDTGPGRAPCRAGRRRYRRGCCPAG